MSSYHIIHTHGDSQGRFFIALPSNSENESENISEAEMTYRRIGPNEVAIDHTYVPPEHRGENIAAELVEFGIRALAEQGDKIVPICPYVVALFKRKPQWRDFLAS